MKFMPVFSYVKTNFMKKLLSIAAIVTSMATINLFSSCSKSSTTTTNNQPTVKKEYRLFNQSSGTPVDAGLFTIS